MLTTNIKCKNIYICKVSYGLNVPHAIAPQYNAFFCQCFQMLDATNILFSTILEYVIAGKNIVLDTMSSEHCINIC